MENEFPKGREKYTQIDLMVDQWKSNQENTLFAQRRAAELADEFTRLETQIAAVLLALTGFLAEKLPTADPFFSSFDKKQYALVVIFLVGSLVTGLMHIKKKEWWWDEHSETRLARRKNWQDAICARKTYEEAVSFNLGISAGHEKVVYSPKWTWILQTTLLGIGVFFLAGLFFNLYGN